jgi:5-methylcytosine-specific restriction endonuclease McrA
MQLPRTGLFLFMTYQEQLLTPEWKATRYMVIERDFGMCQKCMSSKNLEVHHKYYRHDKKAWEYPLSSLITLCNLCHKAEHDLNPDLKPLIYA